MSSEKLRDYPAARGCLFWLGAMATVIILGIVAYAIYLVRDLVPFVGYAWILSLSLAPGLGVVFAVVFLVKYIFRPEFTELGPTGNVSWRFWETKEYHPLGIKEHRVRIREEKEKFVAPALLDLLKSGQLGNGDLLLGYHIEGDQRWGTWNDLRSFAIAGKSRSGKTVTMTFFIVQALLGGAVVLVCDHHATKPTGLLKIIEPLTPFLRIARNVKEIVSLTCEFQTEMRARQSQNYAGDMRPWLIVYDEWTGLLRQLEKHESELVTENVLSCNEEYAGYNGFAMVAGHEWTAQSIGGKKGAAVRRGFHATFVHRLDDGDAKFLLKGAAGKKAAARAPSLPKGQAFFMGAEDDEIDYLLIPFYGKEKEAIFEVAGMLQQPQLGGPEMPAELPAFNQKQIASTSTSQGQNTKIELENVIALPHFPEVKPEVKVSDEHYTAVLREIGKRFRKGESPNDIRKSLGVDGGRAMQEINAALHFIREHTDTEGPNETEI